MRKQQLQPVALAAFCAAGLLGSAHATNGMNMEGYGPIATGMGGAATAYDNGTAGMANNPATLQLAPEGHRFDGAVGVLGPDVTATMQMPGAVTDKSKGTSYVMPAIGWTKTDARMTWGVGVFAQGGMGTEYGSDSMLAMGSDGQAMRSELGVGRVILPLSYRVNDRLTLGASLDYVWASLDMAMATSTQRLGGMVTGGTLAGQVPGMMGMNGGATAGRIAFSDTSDFTGAASSTGWGSKVGLTYALSDAVRFGASYHAKTQLSDMETGATAASFSMNNGVSDAGKITVRNFQWPATTAFGVHWQATPKLSIAADVKHIAWADVMENFKMTYTSGQMAPGATLDFALPQNWKDQTVTMLGMAYQVTDKTAVRAGVNLASNPVPADLVHPLFPAIVKNHYTFGLGHQMSDQSSINVSMTVAPKVTVVNNSGPSLPSYEPAMTVTHSQTNFQLMYSYRY